MLHMSKLAGRSRALPLLIVKNTKETCFYFMFPKGPSTPPEEVRTLDGFLRIN